MLDSTTAADIPFIYEGHPLALVAGYVDGPYAWKPQDWERFPPHVRQVRIAIWNDRWDADVLDSEPGNNDARGCVPWIRGKWERGQTPTIYCFSDAGPKGYRISDVRRECDAAGVKRPLFWITDWRRSWSDFDPSGDPSIIALQYAGSAKTDGHFDASVVADVWPGVDPKEEPVSNDPKYLGESPAVVTLRPGEVGWLSAAFEWPDGRRRTVTKKVYAERVGMRFYAIYPPADPDADPTEDLDAQPGMFIVAVSAL